MPGGTAYVTGGVAYFSVYNSPNTTSLFYGTYLNKFGLPSFPSYSRSTFGPGAATHQIIEWSTPVRDLDVLVSFRCLLLLLSVLVASCAPVEQDQIYGAYRSNIERGTERLEVHKDGTYLHTYELDGSIRLKNEGAWKFYSYKEDRRIQFLRYEFVPSTKFGVGKNIADWPAEVMRCGFSLCISVNPESGYVFRKGY